MVAPEAIERLRRIGGYKLLTRILAIFVERAPALAADAARARAQGDMELLGRSAHSLKSAAANLGLDELQRRAFALERAAAGGDDAVIGGQLASLPEVVERAAAAANEALAAAS